MWQVRQGRSDDALPLLQRASRLAPESPRYAYVYAVALHSSGQSKLALEVLDAALDRRPNDQQLLGTAFGIARDTGLSEKMADYRKQLEAR